MSRHAENSPSDDAENTSGPLRLQKILATAGLGSRRQCEELILTGRVEVDRQVVSELGAKADPLAQEIRVDGVNLPKTRLVYFMVNKPMGVLSTNSDPAGRTRVIDLVPYAGRLFTVGRLDMSSEGLILVTNDGDLAQRLTHPRYGVEKTYHVEVAGEMLRKELEQLRKGVHLAEGFAKVVSAKVLRNYKHSTMLEIILSEGRNREIRRLLARVGHKVERLKRVAIGPLRLADLPLGEVRQLERDELKQLRRVASGLPARRKNTARKPKKKITTKPGPAPRTVIGGDASAQRAATSSGRTGGAGRTRPVASKAASANTSVRKPPSAKPLSGKPSAGRASSGKPGQARDAGQTRSKSTGISRGKAPSKGRPVGTGTGSSKPAGGKSFAKSKSGGKPKAQGTGSRPAGSKPGGSRFGGAKSGRPGGGRPSRPGKPGRPKRG